MTTPEPLTDQVRRALSIWLAREIDSRYAICEATGIAQSALSRFVLRERGLASDNLDKLAIYLGLELKE